MDIFSTGFSVSDLTAAVTTGAQDTFASVGPVLALVLGIILAFIFVPKIIAMFKHTGRSSR